MTIKKKVSVAMIGGSQKMNVELNRHSCAVSFFDVHSIIKNHKFKIGNFDLSSLHTMILSCSYDYSCLLDLFKKFVTDKDIIVMNMTNFLHPDWVIENLSNKTLIYACIDDPFTSYSRTSGSLFAYHGVFHFSVGYDENFLMHEKIKQWGVQDTHFWPPTDMKFGHYNEDFYARVESSFNNRKNFMTYVGLLYGPKFDRLVSIKRKLGHDLEIYGRWPFGGYAGYLGPLKGRKFLPQRVKALSDDERTDVYLSTLSSLNMHLSEDAREFGNMRVFETIRHGMLLVSDKGSKNSHELIFEDGKDAVFYDNETDLFEKIDYLKNNRNEALDIAMRGFQLAKSKYDVVKNLKEFLDWCIRLKEKNMGA